MIFEAGSRIRAKVRIAAGFALFEKQIVLETWNAAAFPRFLCEETPVPL
ncbi:hypothetical protein [Mediterranea massiliensis]|nr:hypothetical protein [Mediterranea massiliensis]